MVFLSFLSLTHYICARCVSFYRVNISKLLYLTLNIALYIVGIIDDYDDDDDGGGGKQMDAIERRMNMGRNEKLNLIGSQKQWCAGTFLTTTNAK